MSCRLERVLRLPSGLQTFDRIGDGFAGSVLHAVAALEMRYEVSFLAYPWFPELYLVAHTKN